MLTCPVNVSEGRDLSVVSQIAGAAGESLLDVHSDATHNRSVLTLGGPQLDVAVRAVARAALAAIDVRVHSGVHPRVGAVDVVPFVPIAGDSLDEALAERDSFAEWAGEVLSLPVFLYGPERTLPDIRRGAFREISPDKGPPSSHKRAGACCVGPDFPLVAWNAWLAEADLNTAKRIVRELRAGVPGVRALAFEVDEFAQVSCNLVDPDRTGPDVVYDFVNERAAVARAELVGLVPDRVLQRVPKWRWDLLDLGVERTIEARLGG